MTNIHKPSFFFLCLLISFGSITAVAFTPALPQISLDFAINAGQAGWTVSIFLIGYACGQLLYGPLANRYGRKVALYIGMTLEIIGSLFCAWSYHFDSFQMLLWARLLMALGASVGLKMSFTLVADSYPPEQGRKMISQLLAGFAITPALGVAIGGFLVDHFNWPVCFYFTAVYGVLLLYLSTRMTESAKVLDPHALKLKTIYHKYGAVLKTVQLPLASMLMGSIVSLVYIFATLAPFIAMDIMHLRPGVYGLWNLLPIVGVLIGSQLSAQFSPKFSFGQAIGLGIIILAGATLFMFLAFLSGYVEAIFLFLPTMILRIGTSLVYANASTIATSSSDDKSNASAMMSFISMGITTLSVLALGFVHTPTALLMPIIYGCLVLLAIILTLLLLGYQKRLIQVRHTHID